MGYGLFKIIENGARPHGPHTTYYWGCETLFFLKPVIRFAVTDYQPIIEL